MSEGNTPLVRATRLKEVLGLRALYLKDERRNPTGSFKDRGTIVALQHALDLGLTRVGTVSTGNMAASVAAYAARAGLDCYVMVSANINPQKLGPIAIYGARLLAVEGDYGELYFRSLEIGRELGIYFANSDDPYRVEGQKTIVYELWESLGDTMVDFLVLPVSSGGHMAALVSGLMEFRHLDLLQTGPTIVGVQAEGASPITSAYEDGRDYIKRFTNPQTIAHAISNPYPPSGNRVLRQLRQYGSSLMISVSDSEILSAQDKLAREEGFFVQPAAAAPLAGVIKLIRTGKIDQGHRVVCLLTGDGLKDMSIFEQWPPNVRRVTLADVRSTIESYLT